MVKAPTNQFVDRQEAAPMIVINCGQNCSIARDDSQARALGRKALHELGTIVTPRPCFAGTESWWHGSGRMLKDAVLVDLARAKNW